MPLTRYYILENDTTTAGGLVQTTTNPIVFNVDGKKQSCIGDNVWCPACQSMGQIIPSGPRLSFSLGSAMPALNDDLCLCKCSPPPKLINSQTSFKEIIDDDNVMKYLSKQNLLHNQKKDKALFNLKFQVKNNVGKPIVNTQYLLVDEIGNIHFGTTDESGYTQIINSDREMEFSIHIFSNELES